ncbi:MAG: VCBS repeat-containing protein, partial [Bacteroidota bacterium]
TFSDNSIFSGTALAMNAMCVAPGDYNNDGHLDFFILRSGWVFDLRYGTQPNSLIKNNGDGTFSDVTIEAGLYTIRPTQTGSWVDFDLDGNLDLLIGNETPSPTFTHNIELYKNKGDGTFVDVAQEWGLAPRYNQYIKGITTSDFNNDGLPDIYISNFMAENVLLMNNGVNESQQITFTDVSQSAGVTQPRYSFPTWFFDYNNDGWEDIFVASYSEFGERGQAGEVAADFFGRSFNGDYPRIFLNQKNNTFKDVTNESGLQKALHVMGSNYGDLDNDGYLDFYLGTGAPDFRSIVPNRMFRNNAGENFQDVTYSGGFGTIQKGHGVSFADLDNDGDQDVYTVLGGARSGDVFQNALYQNPGNDNAWVTIQLQGTTSNRSAIGSRIKIEVEMPNGESKFIFNTVTSGGSFGCNSLQQEIGLGKATKIKNVSINWANQENDFVDYGPVGMRQKVLMVEGQAAFKKLAYTTLAFKETDHSHHHHNH